MLRALPSEQFQASELSDDEIGRLIAPYVDKSWSLTDPQWQQLVARERARRHLSRRYWFNRVLGWAIPPAIRNRAVEATYDQIWAAADFGRLVEPEQQQSPHEWRDRGYLLNSAVTQKLHLALLTKTVRTLRPATVLEVGSGWGLNLVVLACQCPGTSFRGLELTASGVDLTRRLAAAEQVPQPLLQLMPGPPADPAGYRRIAVDRGSAERLPYADGSFDLVFTRLALEQMESIRNAALSEIARVARRHVVMIESFRELNDEGLRRQYALANNYFRGAIGELPRYGLEAVFSFADWPHKITLKPAFVLAHKQAHPGGSGNRGRG